MSLIAGDYACSLCCAPVDRDLLSCAACVMTRFDVRKPDQLEQDLLIQALLKSREHEYQYRLYEDLSSDLRDELKALLSQRPEVPFACVEEPLSLEDDEAPLSPMSLFDPSDEPPIAIPDLELLASAPLPLLVLPPPNSRATRGIVHVVAPLRSHLSPPTSPLSHSAILPNSPFRFCLPTRLPVDPAPPPPYKAFTALPSVMSMATAAAAALHASFINPQPITHTPTTPTPVAPRTPLSPAMAVCGYAAVLAAVAASVGYPAPPVVEALAAAWRAAAADRTVGHIPVPPLVPLEAVAASTGDCAACARRVRALSAAAAAAGVVSAAALRVRLDDNHFASPGGRRVGADAPATLGPLHPCVVCALNRTAIAVAAAVRVPRFVSGDPPSAPSLALLTDAADTHDGAVDAVAPTPQTGSPTASPTAGGDRARVPCVGRRRPAVWSPHIDDDDDDDDGDDDNGGGWVGDDRSSDRAVTLVAAVAHRGTHHPAPSPPAAALPRSGGVCGYGRDSMGPETWDCVADDASTPSPRDADGGAHVSEQRARRLAGEWEVITRRARNPFLDDPLGSPTAPGARRGAAAPAGPHRERFVVPVGAVAAGGSRPDDTTSSGGSAMARPRRPAPAGGMAGSATLSPSAHSAGSRSAVRSGSGGTAPPPHPAGYPPPSVSAAASDDADSDSSAGLVLRGRRAREVMVLLTRPTVAAIVAILGRAQEPCTCAGGAPEESILDGYPPLPLHPTTVDTLYGALQWLVAHDTAAVALVSSANLCPRTHAGSGQGDSTAVGAADVSLLCSPVDCRPEALRGALALSPTDLNVSNAMGAAFASFPSPPLRAARVRSPSAAQRSLPRASAPPSDALPPICARHPPHIPWGWGGVAVGPLVVPDADAGACVGEWAGRAADAAGMFAVHAVVCGPHPHPLHSAPTSPKPPRPAARSGPRPRRPPRAPSHCSSRPMSPLGAAPHPAAVGWAVLAGGGAGRVHDPDDRWRPGPWRAADGERGDDATPTPTGGGEWEALSVPTRSPRAALANRGRVHRGMAYGLSTPTTPTAPRELPPPDSPAAGVVIQRRGGAGSRDVPSLDDSRLGARCTYKL